MMPAANDSIAVRLSKLERSNRQLRFILASGTAILIFRLFVGAAESTRPADDPVEETLKVKTLTAENVIVGKHGSAELIGITPFGISMLATDRQEKLHISNAISPGIKMTGSNGEAARLTAASLKFYLNGENRHECTRVSGFPSPGFEVHPQKDGAAVQITDKNIRFMRNQQSAAINLTSAPDPGILMADRDGKVRALMAVSDGPDVKEPACVLQVFSRDGTAKAILSAGPDGAGVAVIDSKDRIRAGMQFKDEEATIAIQDKHGNVKDLMHE
jgi:hypothetical protein